MTEVTLTTFMAVIANLLASGILSVAIYKKRPELKNYLGFNLSISAWCILYIFWIFATDYSFFMIIARFLLVSIIFIPYYFLRFCFEISNTPIPKKTHLFNVTCLTFFSIFAFTDLMFAKASPIMGFQFWPEAGPLFIYYLAYFAICFTYGHVVMYKKIHTDKRTKFIFYSTLIAFSGGATNFLLWYGYTIIPPYGNFSVAVYVLLIAYAIIKHDFLDVSVIVGKNIATFIILGLSLATLTIFKVATVDNIEPLFLLSIGLVVYLTYFGEKSRIFLQTTFEKKFLSGRFNFRAVLERFTADFASCSDIPSMVKIVQNRFFNELDFKNIQVFLPEHYEYKLAGSDTFLRFYHSDEERGNKTLSKLSSKRNAIIKALSNSKSVMSINHCEAATQKALSKRDAQVAIPCFTPKDELICIILVGQKLSEDPINQDDLDLFAAVSRMIPTVLDRIEKARSSAQVDVAHKIQTDILPKAPEIPGLELECFMRSADEVGGDYYDVIQVENFSWVLLGDVTGHGLASGLVMFMVQSIVTAILHTKSDISPAELNYTANQILYQNLQRLDDQRPMTIASVCFDQKGRSFTVSGSHDNYLIYREKTQSIETLELDHFPIGLGFTDLLEKSDFKQEKYKLKKGDIVFMITDGITEAAEAGNIEKSIYTEDRLKDFILTHKDKPIKDIKDILVTDLERFTKGIYHDDVTFIIAKAI